MIATVVKVVVTLSDSVNMPILKLNYLPQLRDHPSNDNIGHPHP